VLIAISFAGACLRAWFVSRHRAAERGGEVSALPALLGVLTLAGVVVALAPMSGGGNVGTNAAATTVVAPGAAPAAAPAAAAGELTRVQQIVQVRCTPCHAARPTQAGFSAAPNGVMLDTLDQLLAHLAQVQQQLSAHAMPLGNLTAMTEDERSTVLMWIGHGAQH
jgi:uncharacterized membrane protein